MKIPIQNIYFMLCYSWNRLEEADELAVSSDSFNNTTNLLGKVLDSGINFILKYGIYREFLPVSEETNSIKGKIDISQSIKKNLFKSGRAICNYDQYTHNVLHNQIIKATLRHLIRAEELDSTLCKCLSSNLLKFSEVTDIDLHKSLFGRIKINRLCKVYLLLIDVCELIFDSLAPDELNPGSYKMRDFIRDDKTMATIFEDFIRNFYKAEQKVFPKVGSELIEWNAAPLDEDSKRFLPKMKTDITLSNNERCIIIDAKYYSETLVTGQYDTEKIHSGHLYQLSSYLINKATKSALKPEGILLYPTVQKSLDLKYVLNGFKTSIKTINLDQPWSGIRTDLLKMIA